MSDKDKKEDKKEDQKEDQDNVDQNFADGNDMTGNDADTYDAFDNWMNDADIAGVELQNQAAALEDAEKEEREFRDASNINANATALGGQLIVRFTNGAKSCFKVASAHLVRKD